MLYFALIAVFILLFGLVSRRLESTIFTAPMAFTAFGLALSPLVGEHAFETEVIHTLAEITLALVLFSDAARIDLSLLRKDHDLPQRMLLLGLPLTIVLGTLAAAWLFAGQLGLFAAAVLASILAPTDAALGQAVVTNPRVPVRIRQALNVEGGINDGIALPAVLIFVSLAAAGQSGRGLDYWLPFVGMQVVLGPLVGLLVGGIGGRLVSLATRTGWMNHSFQQLASLSLAIAALSLAELVHGNGFIAAFVAGITLGNLHRPICECLYEFAEAEGQLMILFTFTLFGAMLVPSALEATTPMMILYALLSLTLLRMLPVSLSLIGTRVRLETHLFLGWFGPRGIASILFGLLVLMEAEFPGRDLVFHTITVTVLLSVVLHGLTAVPGANLYGARVESMKHEDDAPEHADVGEMPLRHMA